MLRISLQAIAMVFVAAFAVISGHALTADAAFPQPSWTSDNDDVARCTTTGGPTNIKPAFVFFGISGPGTMVNGNYIGFVCNYSFERNSPAGRFAGVAVTVNYCGGTAQAPQREEGNYTTAAGSFTVQQKRWVVQNGALITIVLYTNNHGTDDFTTQEMVTGSQNLATQNRPQGAVPCPGGGTTDDPGGGSGSGTWSVSLSADATNLIAGNDFTLTATANATVANSGFAIFIVNQTDGGIVYCQNVKICTFKDFKNEPGSRNYQAFIADLQGQNTQASSQVVNVSWSAWSGSINLTVDDDTVKSGDVVHLLATANPSINGSVYMIRIERQDNGNGGNCLESPCAKVDTYDFGVSYNYVAKVLKNDGTDLRATSTALKITWEATEGWDGVIGLNTAGGINRVAPGTYVTLEAFTDPTLMNTDFVIKITEQGGEGASRTCSDDDGGRCTLVVTGTDGASRSFNAVVVRRDGAGGVKASSSGVVTVSWAFLATTIPCKDGWKAEEVTGGATLLIGGTQRVPLKPGQWVCPKDAVETGADGHVIGHYEERGQFNPNAGPEVSELAKIEVKSSTQMSVDFFRSGVHYTIINLNSGGVEVFFDGIAKSDFRIKSPTAVASVRGTVLTVDVEPGTGKTRVRSYEHEVVVTPENTSLAPVSIFGGDEVTVTSSTKTAVTKFIPTLTFKRRLPGITRDGSN
ncbi:MAG: hypothetical protein ABI577_18445, partial [bacterium]